jgi:hypothetical protein
VTSLAPRLSAVTVLAGALALGMAASGQPSARPASAAPPYLSYTEFAADDTPATVALKRAYNDTVQRYNQSLYEYHVTLERHDRLVDVYNNQSSDPAERRKAREEAEALRVRLNALGRDVRARAGQVDDAARRAAAGGVTLTR